MKYGLIGEKLGHSFSRPIHEALSGLPYELREVPRGGLADFLRNEPFLGINVTIPYKQAVIPYLDALGPSACLTGAVNVIVRSEDGSLTGHNTDFDGFKAMAVRAGVDFRGARVAVLGAGGASKAVAAAARSMGCSSLVFATRHPSGEDQVPLGEVDLYRNSDVIVNATPVGMFPDVDGKILDISGFPNLRGVLDCIYNPIRTNLVLDARERGIPAAGGLAMLVWQAVRAQELFRSVTVSEDAAEEIYSKLLLQARNIVLCGMPASGKSTVGRLLASRLGKEFVDTDELIVAEAGESIPAIFEREGEEGFRSREEAAVRKASGLKGAVIATGGGVVLRPQNVRALKRSGAVVFLDRPLSALEPTDDRPLSRSREALERLFAQRRPLYLGAADTVIENTGTPEAAAAKIESYVKQG